MQRPTYATPRYLVAQGPNAKAHLWTGTDTVCRMWSTGGLDQRLYRVTDNPKQRPTCTMCAAVQARDATPIDAG